LVSFQLALLKNEFGDLAVDSQLASSQAISGVKELLNGCICCNLVGQLSDALLTLRSEIVPDRIVIETSGSAFPATLAMEINRLAREHDGAFVLDGVISVIDVENWKGYDDTSYTAKLQAKYTDLIVFNKWEHVDERRFEECLDRLGDLELQFAWVKSKEGWVDQSVLMGIDGALIAKEGLSTAGEIDNNAENHHAHAHDHQEEVEVLSVTLSPIDGQYSAVDMDAFEEFLLAAPKDEIYRIKGLLLASKPPADSTGERRPSTVAGPELYVLNWAFGRWSYAPLPPTGTAILKGAALRLTIILARGEAMKWQKKLAVGDLIQIESNHDQKSLTVEKIG
jgi:G3E family GTPase